MDDEEINELLKDVFRGIPYKICQIADIKVKVEEIKRIIENEDEREKFGLDNFDLVKLIKATGDIDYIKGIIENKEKREKLGLIDIFDLVELIIATRDIDYIKGIIDNNDKENGVGLKKGFVRLIKATGDIDYIKGIIENKEKREKLKLDGDKLVELIIATRDIDYIKGIIDNNDKENGVGLKKGLVRLIKETGDIDYINGIIESKEKREHLGFDFQDLLPLMIETNGLEYTIEQINSVGIKQNAENSNQKINLPNNMTIGVEIESEGRHSRSIIDISLDNWESKYDGSLLDGVEIVSPILTGNQEQSSESIKKVCIILNALRSKCI